MTRIISAVDCNTGIQVDREMTSEEEAAYDLMSAEAQERHEAQLAELEAQASAKASAQLKLAEFGLTAEEIAAISK